MRCIKVYYKALIMIILALTSATAIQLFGYLNAQTVRDTTSSLIKSNRQGGVSMKIKIDEHSFQKNSQLEKTKNSIIDHSQRKKTLINRIEIWTIIAFVFMILIIIISKRKKTKS